MILFQVEETGLLDLLAIVLSAIMNTNRKKLKLYTAYKKYNKTWFPQKLFYIFVIFFNTYRLLFLTDLHADLIHKHPKRS